MTGRLSPARDDFWLRHAINEIKTTYGVNVYPKWKTLHKFGENLLVGTAEATLMTLPAGVLSETELSDNLITQVSSSSASDTGTLTVEGHTISGNKLTFVTQNITLDGQTAVTLPTPTVTATRMKNTSSAGWVGDVYVSETDTRTAGVPDTAAKVHLIGLAAENGTLKASTAFSDFDFALVTNFYANVNKKTASGAVIRLRTQPIGGVYTTQFKRGINALGSDLDYDFRPYFIVPPNTRIKQTAEADGASTAIAGGFNSILCKIDPS